MKKISVLILFCLIILTAVTKNSSKNLESQIFLKNETISLLKEKNEMAELELSFLSSPEKLKKYHELYFKNELKIQDINNFRIMTIKDNLIFIKEKKIFQND